MRLWKGNVGVMVDVDTSSECLVVLIHRMFNFLPSRSIRTSTILPTTIIARHYSGQPWPTSATTWQILAHAALDCLFYLHMQVLSTLGLGNVTGYPGVFQSNPCPYPSKPVPVSTGAGFHGYGLRVYKNPRVPQPTRV